MSTDPQFQPGVQALRRLLSEAERIVFLTGAGMSTESGIPDFRSSSGLYASGASEDLFDIDAFRRRPERFYASGRVFLGAIRKAKPNPGHRAIARLEHERRKPVSVVTQNIDELHQQAGSTTVYPVHGTLGTFTCLRCQTRVKADELWPQVEAGQVPRHDAHGCDGTFKPDIVFFNEQLPEDVFAGARAAIRAADLLVVAGTSLTVYPAAALPSVRRAGCRLVVINQTPTHLDDEAGLLFRDPAGCVLAAAVVGA